MVSDHLHVNVKGVYVAWLKVYFEGLRVGEMECLESKVVDKWECERVECVECVGNKLLT